MFARTYADVYTGDEAWRSLETPGGDLYEWEPESTYVRHPPYFDGLQPQPRPVEDIDGARCLVSLGDSVTTDHISPAGSIKPDSPAGRYLAAHGIEPPRLQLLRRAPRQPRGHGPRDLCERPAAQPPRSRLRGHLDEALPLRRGDDDLRRLRALPRRGHPADRPRRQGVRLRIVPRLGGEGALAPRRPRRDRRELRAHPPLEPPDDGHPAAPVPARRERRNARPDRRGDVLDRRARGRRAPTRSRCAPTASSSRRSSVSTRHASASTSRPAGSCRTS